jgi:hypothetical protein
MRTRLTLSFFLLALLLGAPHAEAGAITCPPPAPGGAFNAGEGSWSQPYEGPLTSVELRTEISGQRRGEAAIFCSRARGAVRIAGKNCRITPAAGGRITTATERGAEIVTCTLLGTSGTNDTACFVACD